MSRLSKLDPNFKPAFDGPSEFRSLMKKLAAQSNEHVINAYLFGSAAQAKNTVDSDLDILVVIPDSADEKTLYKIVNQPGFSNYAVDWLFKKLSDFLREKESGGVCRIASQSPVRLFE